MKKIISFFTLVLAFASVTAAEARPTRLRGTITTDFRAGIANPSPSSVTFVVPKSVRGTADLNVPPNGRKGLQVPEECVGTFTIDLTNAETCNQLVGLLQGDTVGGRVLARFEDFRRLTGATFESAVTSGAMCSLYEGNITSGADPFAGSLVCAAVGEAFVWQSQIFEGISTDLFSFFSIPGTAVGSISRLHNGQTTSASGIGVNSSSVEVMFR